MPTLPPTPSSVVQVNYHIDLNGDANVKTGLKFAYSGGAPSNSDANTLATGAANAWHTNLASLFTNTCALFLVEVIDLATVNGGVGQQTVAYNGTLTGGVLPVETCLLVNHKIARKYRGGKPRSYWPAGDESKVNTDGRTWTSSFITAANTALAAYYTAMASVTGGSTNITGPVNVSYYHGYNPPTIVGNRAKNHLAPRGTPVVDTITAHTVASILASQRRRYGR